MVRSPRSRSGRGLRRVLAVALLATLPACWQAATMPEPSPAPDPLMDVARRDGSVVVIVQLAVEQRGNGWPRAGIERAQRRLMKELGAGAKAVERFEPVPQMLLRVTPEALRRLRQSPLVVNITANTADAALDSEPSASQACCVFLLGD